MHEIDFGYGVPSNRNHNGTQRKIWSGRWYLTKILIVFSQSCQQAGHQAPENAMGQDSWYTMYSVTTEMLKNKTGVLPIWY